MSLSSLAISFQTKLISSHLLYGFNELFHKHSLGSTSWINEITKQCPQSLNMPSSSPFAILYSTQGKDNQDVFLGTSISRHMSQWTNCVVPSRFYTPERNCVPYKTIIVYRFTSEFKDMYLIALAWTRPKKSIRMKKR